MTGVSILINQTLGILNGLCCKSVSMFIFIMAIAFDIGLFSVAYFLDSAPSRKSTILNTAARISSEE